MSAASYERAAALGAALSTRGWRVATAESCTAGMIAAAITDVAGSSVWFDRGFVTYSDEAKQDMLGVRKSTLIAHGAVSEATVREMVEGALVRSAAELAVAVSGVAGPAGGTPEKPVGMVCFAWGGGGGAVEIATRHFAGDRAGVREAAVIVALEGLLERARWP